MKDIDLSLLSDDAKVVAGCVIGNMTSRSTLTFEMRENRPTERMKAALNELVEKRVLGVIDNSRGALIYQPLMNCHDAFVWFMKLSAKRQKQLSFTINEPIAGASS